VSPHPHESHSRTVRYSFFVLSGDFGSSTGVIFLQMRSSVVTSVPFPEICGFYSCLDPRCAGSPLFFLSTFFPPPQPLPDGPPITFVSPPSPRLISGFPPVTSARLPHLLLLLLVFFKIQFAPFPPCSSQTSQTSPSSLNFCFFSPNVSAFPGFVPSAPKLQCSKDSLEVRPPFFTILFGRLGHPPSSTPLPIS